MTAALVNHSVLSEDDIVTHPQADISELPHPKGGGSWWLALSLSSLPSGEWVAESADGRLKTKVNVKFSLIFSSIHHFQSLLSLVCLSQFPIYLPLPPSYNLHLLFHSPSLSPLWTLSWLRVYFLPSSPSAFVPPSFSPFSLSFFYFTTNVCHLYNHKQNK